MMLPSMMVAQTAPVRQPAKAKTLKELVAEEKARKEAEKAAKEAARAKANGDASLCCFAA